MRANIIRLDDLQVRSGQRRPRPATGGGGAANRADELPEATRARIRDHPCYSEEAHHHFARMHVAVAPACNIQCNYCNRRYDCANESRPGVVSERLTPEEAARQVLAVGCLVPELSVLGSAGPGDGAYDWARTKATFELVRRQIPDLKLCLSTNGLALPEHVDELAAMNVAHVTVTINMIDPHVGEAIYPWIFWQHRRRYGLEAARILHERQMESLDRLRERDILIKVNSVLIPGVNDDHLVDVNAAVKERGAFLHNIMPLISAPEHGTVFGLEGRRGPTPMELQAVQDRCGGGARLMRHCRQCRADAIGMLGEDRCQSFTRDRLSADPVYDPTERDAYRAWVDAERADRQEAVVQAAADAAAIPAPPLLVAVCTKGGGRINLHFGKAREFQIYEVDARGVRLVGHRRADNYCLGGRGDPDRLERAIEALAGVPVLLCQRIGNRPREALAAAGIEVIEDHAEAYIETAVAAVYSRAAAAPTSARA